VCFEIPSSFSRKRFGDGVGRSVGRCPCSTLFKHGSNTVQTLFNGVEAVLKRCGAPYLPSAMNGTNSSAGEPSASGGAVSSSSGFVETGTQEITAFVESNWEGPCGIIYGGAKDCSVINGVRRVGVYRDACQCDSGDGDLWPTNPGACFELKSGTDELSLCDDCSSTRVCRPVAKTQLLVNGGNLLVNCTLSALCRRGAHVYAPLSVAHSLWDIR